MADKYSVRDLVTGLWKEVIAVVVGGIGNAGKIVALGLDGRLAADMMPVGIVADMKTALAGEALTAGDFCYVNASNEIVRASGASGGHEATGFVLASSLSGASATIYFEGRNTALTGLVVGTRYFLSDTPGSFTSTPVQGAGKIHQSIGSGAEATEMATEFGEPIILAS